MGTAAITPESLTAAGAFVARTLAEHPDRALSAEALIGVLRAVECVEGAILDGIAVELGRRLARLHGLPAPAYPVEFHLDFARVGDRALALWALAQVGQLEALAAPWPSREARLLALGAARLLAADPLILHAGRPAPRGGLERRSAA